MSDKLLGDITSEVLKSARLDRLASRYSKITGKPCNCNQRAKQLNELHRKLSRKANTNERE